MLYELRLACLAAQCNAIAEDWDPRLQTILLHGSCDRIQKEVSNALSSLVNIFCRVAINATQLKTLRNSQAQQRLADASEAEFVAAVTSLRLEHGCTWSVLLDLQHFLEEKYRSTYVLWVQFARMKIDGLSGVLPIDPQELWHTFFASVDEMVG